MDNEKLRGKFPGGIIRDHHPFYMADAIRDIPGCLDACISLENLAMISRSMNGFRPASIHTVGCGTSFNACQAAAYTLSRLLDIPVTAWDAYDFELDTPAGIDQQTMVIGISESGQSITTCLAIEKSRLQGAFTVGISANPESRLARAANLSLADPFLHEIPLGKTRTYVSTALLAMLAGISLAGEEARQDFVNQIRSVNSIIRSRSGKWQQAAKGIVNSFPIIQQRYMVTGFGAQKANADEIRLKIMEILGESATSFGLEEFTHGPSACFKNDLIVILLQTDERTLERALCVANGVVQSEAALVIITDRGDAGWPQAAKVIELPKMNKPAIFGQFPAAVAAQYLLYYQALHKGLNPDVNLEDINPKLGDIYAFFFPPGTH